jgi:hypothetical protein
VTPLQTPSQAAPSGIAVTASAVSSPSAVPNAPSVTASSVTSPNASVSSPSTVSSVTSPSSSSTPVSSVSSVVPPVSSVKPVGVTVKPLGYYDPWTGKCLDGKLFGLFDTCQTETDLQTLIDSEKCKKARNTGNSNDVECQEAAARQEARRVSGNDLVGDQLLNEILRSEMYRNDFGSESKHCVNGQCTAQRVVLLRNLTEVMRTGIFGKDELIALGRFMSGYRIDFDMEGRPYFYLTGTTPFSSTNFPISTHELRVGSNSIYLNGNSQIFSNIFGKVGAGLIIGFLAASSAGMVMYEPMEGRRGEYTPSNRRNGIDYDILDFSRDARVGNFRSMPNKPSNPCDSGMIAPKGLITAQGYEQFNAASAINNIRSAIGGNFTNNPIENGSKWGTLFLGSDGLGNDKRYDILQNTKPLLAGARDYENYGNYFLGLSAASLNMSLESMLNSSRGGQWINRTAPSINNYSYPDQPKDWFWITRGYEYVKSGCKL